MTEPNRSAMLPEPGPIASWMWRRLFARIPIDEAAVERTRAHARQGQLVYVMRVRSLLDYLFFNYLFLKVKLPLARFANGVDPSLFRGVGTFLREWWRRLFGRGEIVRPSERLLRVVRAGDAALIFMKRRRFTEERPADPGYFEALLAWQRTQETPLLLVPQLMTWQREPASKQPGLLDAVFGNQDTPGRLRKLGFWLRHRKQATMRLGEPINLKGVLADHPDWSDERIARKLRRVLFIHLAQETMSVRGPAVKAPEDIKREVMERKVFQDEVAAIARQVGISPAEARIKARRHLDEIAATTTFELLHVFGWVLDRVFNRVFRGVEVDAEGMRRVREAARHSRGAPLVLVPSHKSHLDYLVISWVFMRNEFIPPHIAAGDNLAFFPMGGLLRRAGAFFLRRSFKGQPLYTLVFRRYLWKLLREGYPIEFFMEGGRSRTGKLLPPKLGMLGMFLEGVRRGEYKDLQFVPINISYERVLETDSYRRELTGGEKKAESMKGVVKAGKVLRSRYGRVYVSFEEPVKLSTWLAGRSRERLADLTPERIHAQTRSLAFHLMRRIQEATTVSPSALLGAVLLSHEQPAMAAERLAPMVGFLLEMLERRGARLSHALSNRLAQHATAIEAAGRVGGQAGDLARYQARGEAVRPLIDEALTLLRRLVEDQERGGRRFLVVPERARIELDYYRNGILGILAAECIVATVLHSAGGTVTHERLTRQVRALSLWFRREFIYRDTLTFTESLADTVQRLVAEGLLGEEGGNVVVRAPRIVAFLAGMLRHLVEGYWVAADALRGLEREPMEQKGWMAHAREHAERLYLEGEITRVEAASTAILGNALELFREEHLVERAERGGGRRPVVVYALGGSATAEAVAFRRDDLGEFLARKAVPILVRPATPPGGPAAVEPTPSGATEDETGPA